MSAPTREVELKARVDDIEAARSAMQRAGATLVFEGTLHDRLYDTPDRALTSRDHVLRLRSYQSANGATDAHLDWKGPTSREGGFKVRAELTTGITEPAAMREMLARLGYEIVSGVDRHIAQYELAVADDKVMVRFEVYPRMDTLVEVEGTTAAIEQAIVALGIPRDRFNAGRLASFVREYEARTGVRASTCNDGLTNS